MKHGTMIGTAQTGRRKMIDRNKAIEVLGKMPLCNECDSSFPYNCAVCAEAFLMAMEALKQPEIVRCKDCIHYRYYGLSVETVSECTIDHCENPDADWFCADGKREGMAVK